LYYTLGIVVAFSETFMYADALLPLVTVIALGIRHIFGSGDIILLDLGILCDRRRFAA